MLDRIRIVLIGTSHPGNVGAAARAMKTMGLGDLALVSPRCEPNAQEAISRASGADDILDAMHRFEDLETALADCTWVVGCSARSRTLPWPMQKPREFSANLPAQLSHDNARVAIVFGREDAGLNNAELQRCHAHVHIPTNEAYSSLNLAAAVQVMAYECRQAWLEYGDNAASATSQHAEPFGVEWDNPLATHDDLERFFAHLERTLIAIDFHDPNNPRQLMARMRRLFLRAHVDHMEINMLRGILSAVDKSATIAPSKPAQDRE
ncbi:RNA methyltransferase [Phytohalomonas tamaricis]|uniref:RNA methyltransferase n=1 Tax=Phytohalomonas tamaricis TaxID=2081032 RepID=UPI000D0B940F|nr:RNA methyltransferase [Phytohalomonas tamaricis]